VRLRAAVRRIVIGSRHQSTRRHRRVVGGTQRCFQHGDSSEPVRETDRARRSSPTVYACGGIATAPAAPANTRPATGRRTPGTPMLQILRLMRRWRRPTHAPSDSGHGNGTWSRGASDPWKVVVEGPSIGDLGQPVTCSTRQSHAPGHATAVGRRSSAKIALVRPWSG
jgi:hypothetical protein